MTEQLPFLSIVIPVHNEEENLHPLYEEISAALNEIARSHEILFVDDGSTDGSYEALLAIFQQDTAVRLFRFARNEGQTAALREGMRQARGELIITLDGDGQNDPRDIPRFIARYEQTKDDLICGWRRLRHDRFWGKRFPSLIANSLLQWLLGTPVHDSGCTLKLMTRDLARQLPWANGFHRFIPALARRIGARISEIEVHHRPRLHGRSNYGWERLIPVARDIVFITFAPLPRDRWGFPFVVLAGIAFCRLVIGWNWTASLLVPVLATALLIGISWARIQSTTPPLFVDERSHPGT